MSIHLEDRVRIRPYSYIQQHCISRIELLTEAIEEPVMRIQFATLFVFDAEK